MASSSCTGRRRRSKDDEEEVLTDIAIALCSVATLETTGRQLQHTSISTGHEYMLEVLNGHADRIFDKCHMDKVCFTYLCDILAQQDKLRPTKKTSLEEQVMIFLTSVGKNETIRMMMEDFQHSSETISRYVSAVCKDCIGAIDSTHVYALVPHEFGDRYRNRKGTLSQNVMAVCDFRMMFTYVTTG
ncbi:uncharacterized protein LOC116108202 [Pistacia vera]|uniref:uncharacterized protein LOC116108202 n=1 Tax=Pistacia vera TaxID=55513 RepID=UPI001263CE67|nr:uncharacterized protein LOC116108202 [Pistacia vera]